MMKWNAKAWCLYGILSVATAVISVIALRDIHATLGGIYFAQLLLIGAVWDIQTRTIPNFLHPLLLLTVLFTLPIQPGEALLGMVGVAAPYLLAAILSRGRLGGGDIKLMAAAGFVLGLYRGTFATILALSLAVLCNIIIGAVTKQRNTSFALAPYLGVGCFIAYLI